ncbi:MAG: tetratricopeptide repeat protein [Asgard group archaeon]|nr:tetratricopeptide repeat protein [Asgard group archaeon]
MNSDVHDKSPEELEKCVKELQKQLQDDPSNIELLMELSSCFRHLDKYNEAIMIHEQILEKHPNVIDYLFMKGLVLFEATRDEEAIAIFDEILKKDSNHRDAMFNKGLALKRLGKKAEAKECMRKALR